jgi:hypothetical protein
MRIKRKLTAVAAGLALAAGLGLGMSAPAASASTHPAAAASSSFTHTVVLEPGVHDGRMVIYATDLESRWSRNCKEERWFLVRLGPGRCREPR